MKAWTPPFMATMTSPVRSGAMAPEAVTRPWQPMGSLSMAHRIMPDEVVG